MFVVEWRDDFEWEISQEFSECQNILALEILEKEGVLAEAHLRVPSNITQSNLGKVGRIFVKSQEYAPLKLLFQGKLQTLIENREDHQKTIVLVALSPEIEKDEHTLMQKIQSGPFFDQLFDTEDGVRRLENLVEPTPWVLNYDRT